MHGKFQCLAKNVDCHNYGKQGHYRKMCRATKCMSAVIEVDDSFLGIMYTGKHAWTVD